MAILSKSISTHEANALATFEAAPTEPFTAHDSRVEKVALIVDPDLPWVVRRGGPLPIIVGRYATQEETDCVALAANHANDRTLRQPWPLEVASFSQDRLSRKATGRLSGRFLFLRQ